MWLLLSVSAGAAELVEPVAVTEPVQVGTRTWTAPDPIYLVPTKTFDRFLADAHKLKACTDGLDRVEGKLFEARQRLEASQNITSTALTSSAGALTACSEQMTLDERTSREQIEFVIELQERVGRAQAQRNVALAAGAGVVTAILVKALLDR